MMKNTVGMNFLLKQHADMPGSQSSKRLLNFIIYMIYIFLFFAVLAIVCIAPNTIAAIFGIVSVISVLRRRGLYLCRIN